MWGNQIWLTTTGEGGRELFAIFVDLETGKVVHYIKEASGFVQNPTHDEFRVTNVLEDVVDDPGPTWSDQSR